MSTKKVRITGPDIVRSLAALFVVAVHFFYNCGYYDTPMVSKTMFIMTAARWLFLTCVPLYMMLTGYFKCNKEPDKAHYMSLIPVLISYIIISVIKVFTGNHYYGKLYGIKEALQALGNYTIAWYVGFYFSLMAIAPFLNRLWHALKNKKEKLLLIGSLAVISSLYPIISLLAVSNLYPVAVIGSVLEIGTPNYWQMLYPLLYYFLGCYFREYTPKINKLIPVITIIATVLINSGISYYYANGGNFLWNILGAVDCGYNCITVVLCSAAIFLLFYDIDLKNSIIKRILQMISEVSLEIYLFSAIFDIIFFSYAKARYFAINDFAKLFFIMVPLNFLCAFICSTVYHYIYSIIRRAIRK